MKSQINSTVMKNNIRNIFFVVLMFSSLAFSCKKDLPSEINFTPKDKKISALYEKMRFGIVTPNEVCYYFSSDSATLRKTVDNMFRYYLLPMSEMKEVSYSLSDTTYFKWEEMLSSSPYPVDHVVLSIYGYSMSEHGYNDYMCSIGSAKDAIPVLNALFKPISGEARIVVDELVRSLSKK